METVLLLIFFLFSTGANILCFLIGAKTGQKVAKGETVEMPILTPLETFRHKQNSREAQAEQDKLDTIMQNIERFDGTGFGQKEVR